MRKPEALGASSSPCAEERVDDGRGSELDVVDHAERLRLEGEGRGLALEQIPSGNGAWVPEGHGVKTERERGVSGGTKDDDTADGGRPARSLRRWAWNDRCLIWFSAWYFAS
jgi:hypothetical protein